MSDSPQSPTFDNSNPFNPAEPAETPVATPLIAEDPSEPIATPLVTKDSSIAAPADPITGNGYTNTSNGNQVAVLSTIDYSTNTIIYNYTLISNSTEHNSSSSYYNMNGGTTTSDSPISAGSSADMTVASGNSSLSAGSPDDVTGAPGNASLQRNGFHLRFNSSAYFRSQGARRIDRIMGFNGTNGDKLELSRRVFKGIGELEFESVDNRRQLKRAAKSDADIIYQESNGRLFFNANGDTKGFGDQGGMFSILESTPFLSSDHFILI
jgi:hypothetical protein